MARCGGHAKEIYRAVARERKRIEFEERSRATDIITPDQNAVIAEIFIAAPPARVFQAISDPAQLPKWWGQSGLYHVVKSTMDVRPGGKWRSDGIGADGKEFYVEGEYLEVEPPRLLEHTCSYSGPLTRLCVGSSSRRR